MNAALLITGVVMAAASILILGVVDNIFPYNLALSIPGGALAGIGATISNN